MLWSETEWNIKPTLSCPSTEKDTLHSRDRKKNTKTSLKFYQRDGQISSSGQLASRNYFFLYLFVSMKGSPFVCQTHAFILYCYFLYTVCTAHTYTHPFNSYMNKLQLPFLFLSSLCTPVSTHTSRQNTHVYTDCSYKHTYSINPHMSCSHFIPSKLLPLLWLMWLLVLEEGSG